MIVHSRRMRLIDLQGGHGESGPRHHRLLPSTAHPRAQIATLFPKFSVPHTAQSTHHCLCSSFSQKKGIVVQSYSPLRGTALAHPARRSGKPYQEVSREMPRRMKRAGGSMVAIEACDMTRVMESANRENDGEYRRRGRVVKVR